MTKIQHKLVGLVSQTSIHVGASSSDNLIDSPIQREAHTDWPVIAGSGMKGAWRCAAETNGDLTESETVVIFGPDTKNASEHAGAVMVSDARLLLLPVRSLTSHYKWVTCPAVLNRYVRDRLRLGYETQPDIVPKVTGQKALVSSDDAPDILYLEEYRFDTEKASLDLVIELLAGLTGVEYRSEIEENLTIVSNDQFSYFCRAAIPLQARIGIDSKTKAVTPTALWYEESLPPETVMYNCLSFTSGRGKTPMSGEQIKFLFNEKLIGEKGFLQVGGNTTVGMGWFALSQVAED